MRPYLYAGLDVIFASFYVWVSRTLIPSSEGLFEAISLFFAAAATAMAVGALTRRRWAWWIGVGGCAALLVGATVLMILLGLSAGYLWGVYGAIGTGAATIVIIGMALVVELYVLLPAFQLRWFLSPERRAAAGPAR